jgi:hypothetical protein
VIAFEIAAAFLEKFGADTYDEVRDSVERHRARLRGLNLSYGKQAPA